MIERKSFAEKVHTERTAGSSMRICTVIFRRGAHRHVEARVWMLWNFSHFIDSPV